MNRPPRPPFTEETAAQKARLAEDAWNSRDPARVALAYTEDSLWRNRDQFLQGREAIVELLTQKWERERDYRLIKEVWGFKGNRMAVRFAYESRALDGDQFATSTGGVHSTVGPALQVTARSRSVCGSVVSKPGEWNEYTTSSWLPFAVARVMSTVRSRSWIENWPQSSGSPASHQPAAVATTSWHDAPSNDSCVMRKRPTPRHGSGSFLSSRSNRHDGASLGVASPISHISM